MSEDARRSRTVLLIVLGVIGLVVVVALAVVLFRGGPASFAADSPEGVVQRYVQAVMDDDIPAARALLAPERADPCEEIVPDDADHRVTLLQTDVRDDTARVRVLIATTYDTGSLGGDGYQTEDVFGLVKADGGWLIDSTPWPFAVCQATVR